MIDDEYRLTVKEAADRMNVDTQTVQYWLKTNDLRVRTGPDGQQGIDAESLEELATAMAMPSDDERTSAMFALRERNASSAQNPTI